MLTTIALSALLTSSVGVPGPCDLLTREAAEGLLGQKVTAPQPSGPELDEDSGGMRSVCVYQAGTRMLFVIRVAFASPAAARAATTRELVTEHYGEGEKDFTITEAPGLGDQAFWAYTDRGAEFIVVKGASVLGVTLGGMPKAPSTYQAQLRALTVTVANKL